MRPGEREDVRNCCLLQYYENLRAIFWIGWPSPRANFKAWQRSLQQKIGLVIFQREDAFQNKAI